MANRYCSSCGRELGEESGFCPGCGTSLHQTAAVHAPEAETAVPVPRMSEQRGISRTEKLILPAFLLCFFLGVFGAHRFYVGKVGTGILQLLTLGGLGVWALIDMIMIIVGAFTDRDGNKITEWT